MARRSTKNYFSQFYEKTISWFWVILFISAIFYLRWLLVEMHVETTRLADERQRFTIELEEEREKSKELYEEFYADLNDIIQRTIKDFYQGEIPYKYIDP